MTEIKRWKVRYGERVVESEIGEHEVSESLNRDYEEKLRRARELTEIEIGNIR